MLNGKYNNFLSNKLEDATITSADKYVKNGVLHIIDKYILVLPNLWDHINSTTAQYTQNSFIAGLNFSTFDPSLAVIDSISSSTGLPVYHPGTGIVIKNSFNEKVFDTRREDKQYTYFIIENAGFTLKADSLKPYFKSSATATTDSLDKWNIVKDQVVDILYPTVASLPAVLVSKFGIPIPNRCFFNYRFKESQQWNGVCFKFIRYHYGFQISANTLYREKLLLVFNLTKQPISVTA